jgi:hypothetical protein
MASFRNWMTLRESRDDLLKCPHPKDKEYCKQWNKWIRGELKSPPVYSGKEASGHWEGRRSGETPTRKSMIKRKAAKGKGRYDWRKDQ